MFARGELGIGSSPVLGYHCHPAWERVQRSGRHREHLPRRQPASDEPARRSYDRGGGRLMTLAAIIKTEVGVTVVAADLGD